VGSELAAGGCRGHDLPMEATSDLPSVSTVPGETARRAQDDGGSGGEPPALKFRCDLPGLDRGSDGPWRKFVRMRATKCGNRQPTRLTALPSVRPHSDSWASSIGSAACCGANLNESGQQG